VSILFLLLSLHDALPIFLLSIGSPITIPSLLFLKAIASRKISGWLFSYTLCQLFPPSVVFNMYAGEAMPIITAVLSSNASISRRSEEHTSELQSRENLVC